MSSLVRELLTSAVAGSLPIVIAAIWGGRESTLPVAGYVFFLWIALVARYFGAVPALVCTATSTVILYGFVLVPAHAPAGAQIAMLVAFVLAALAIVGASRGAADDRRAAKNGAKRLRGLFDSVADSIIFFDSRGRIIEANPAAATLVGVSRETLIGTRIGELTTSPDRTISDAFIAELKIERLLRGRFVVQKRDGTFREVEYGAVVGVLPGVHAIVAHDVTEQNESERAFSDLSRRLIELQEQERQRIAREFHDTSGNLATLRRNVSRIVRTPDPPRELVEKTLALIDRSASEIQTLSYLLHPPMIDQEGLLATLRWYVHGFEERSGIVVRLDAKNDLGRLSPTTATFLFRVMQEALATIHRHSNSAEATVRLKREDGVVQLEVIDEASLPCELIEKIDALGAFGVGLAGMRDRIGSLGGTLRVDSGNGGTRLSATLPADESEDQTRAELLEQLQRAARQWRETFDAVDSPIMIFDHEPRLERLNRAAAALAGTEPAHLIGRPALELKNAGGVFSEAANIAIQIVATNSEDGVVTNRTSSGGRTLVVRGNPIETGRGRGVCIIVTDVTDLTTMEEALRSAETMSRLGTFVAGVAHEVRNPLFGISAAVDAIAPALQGPELREYAAGLRQEVRRMTELMSDLLTYGHPAQPVLEVDSLESVVRASASAVRALAQKQQVSIRITTGSNLHAVEIDRSRLQQVFDNLLKNAISFSPHGSVVDVRCHNVDAAEGSWIECAIADRGRGVAGEDLPHVFEPFFTRRRGGTGLGLAIVDRIVREHQGQVSLTNGEGGGALATVRLPAAEAENVDGA